MLTRLPVCGHRCADCGAPAADGRSCPDRLYDVLVNCRGEESQYRLVLACFALQHPHTHSANCLAVARFQLESAVQAAGQDPSDVCQVSRWIADNLARLGFRPRWQITIANFREPHPGSDAELALAWAREVLRKSRPALAPVQPC